MNYDDNYVDYKWNEVDISYRKGEHRELPRTNLDEQTDRARRSKNRKNAV